MVGKGKVYFHYLHMIHNKCICMHLLTQCTFPKPYKLTYRMDIRVYHIYIYHVHHLPEMGSSSWNTRTWRRLSSCLKRTCLSWRLLPLARTVEFSSDISTTIATFAYTVQYSTRNINIYIDI